MTSAINPGDIVRVRVTFRDIETGDLVDPEDVTVRWKLHGGEETTWVFGIAVEVENDSTGLYHADVPITEKGLHYYRWTGNGPGAVSVAEESHFTARTWFDQEGS